MSLGLTLLFYISEGDASEAAAALGAGAVAAGGGVGWAGAGGAGGGAGRGHRREAAPGRVGAGSPATSGAGSQAARSERVPIPMGSIVSLPREGEVPAASGSGAQLSVVLLLPWCLWVPDCRSEPCTIASSPLGAYIRPQSSPNRWSKGSGSHTSRNWTARAQPLLPHQLFSPVWPLGLRWHSSMSKSGGWGLSTPAVRDFCKN